jgi:hypothetical protein
MHGFRHRERAMASANNKLKPTVFIDSLTVTKRNDVTTRAKRLNETRQSGRAAARRRSRRHHGRVRWARVVALAFGLALLAGCSSKRVLMPPRMDLTDYYRIGLVTFTIENAKGSLHELATERFLADVLDGQPGIEVIELGDAERVLAEIGESELGARAAQRIGDAHGIPAVFFGHLEVSDVKPRGQLTGLALPHLEANVTVDLRVRLLTTEAGGTVWSNSARATESVGQVGFDGSMPYFSAEDPEEAYGRLVDYLVHEVSFDFRPYWVKQ